MKRVAITLFILINTASFAASELSTNVASRSARKIGIGLLMPTDSITGAGTLNALYNITDFIQIFIGAGASYASGEIGWGFTFNGGVNLFVPDWSLSPMIGISDSSTTGKTVNTSNLINLRAGFDWQFRFGLDLGAGVNYTPALPINDLVAFSPYIRIGYFF